MGAEGTKRDGAGGCAEGPEASGGKPPKSWVAALCSLFTLVAVTISVIYRGSVLGTDALTEIAHWLFLALAVGWVTRATIHAIIGYFRRTKVEGVRPYTLPLVSAVNSFFAIVWLCVAIFVALENSGAATTALATATACLVSFLLALVTHWAAQKAGRPRASEKVKEKLRGPLDPGFSTPIGWPLVKLIDSPSPPHLLSTYVAGSLATLLLILILTASAAVSESDPGDSQTVIEKTAAPQPNKPQANDPIAATPPADPHPSPVGLRVEATKEAIDLLCLPVKPRAPHPPRHHLAPPPTYFCIIVVDDQITSRFLILTRSPLP